MSSADSGNTPWWVTTSENLIRVNSNQMSPKNYLKFSLSFFHKQVIWITTMTFQYLPISSKCTAWETISCVAFSRRQLIVGKCYTLKVVFFLSFFLEEIKTKIHIYHVRNSSFNEPCLCILDKIFSMKSQAQFLMAVFQKLHVSHSSLTH